jgi:zinc protease
MIFMIFRLATAFSVVLTTIQPLAAQSSNPAAIQKAAPSPAWLAWGFNKSDLIPDPAPRFGVLPNGMKYAIMRNETPKQNASVRMRFDVGSTAEADDQRGLAHFLEHMAFNGSKRVPEGEMIKLLERNGLSFGADTNASTGFTETVYKLDLPQVNEPLIDTALMLMRETASELTIDPGAVDRERGIIMGEMRARDNFGLRRFADLISFLAPGTPVSKGLPIGTEAVIKTAPAQRLRDLYEQFYTPERATLVIVGDVDPAQIEAKIIAKFGDWSSKKNFIGDPVKGVINPSRPADVRFFFDKDVTTMASIARVRPIDDSIDTVAKRRRDMIDGLGNAMLNRRLARVARLPDAPFTNASADTSTAVSTAELTALDIVAKDRDWKRALAAGEQELRRAVSFGFTEAELKEQISNVRTSLKNAADQATTRQNAGLANAILSTVEDNTVFTTPQSGLARFEELAASLTLADVNAAFRAQWSGGDPLIHVSHNEGIADGKAQIAGVWAASKAVQVAAPAANDNAGFAHTDFGTPGAVATDTRIADLDIRTVRFANNVRLNIKKTDFEKGKVRVSVRIGGGSLELPKTADGLGIFMSSIFAAGGTTKHSGDDLQSVLAGRAVSAGISAETDAFTAGGTTTPSDLALQMQVFAAFMTAPGYRLEAEAQWKNIVGVYMQQIASQPQGIVFRDVQRILASGNNMVGLPTEAVLKTRNFAELKPILDKSFGSGPIEIGIVGDISEADAIAVVAKTFGALPMRALARPNYAKINPMIFPKSRAPITLTHDGKPDQAMALVYWPTTDDGNFRESVRMDLLGQILKLRATEILREKLGATYSPGASSYMSSIFKGYGYTSISSTTEPGKVDTIFAAVDEITSNTASTPIPDDLINRARSPMIERIHRSHRENGTWIGLVDEAQSLPGDLEDYRNQEAVLKSITAKELQVAAKQYLSAKSALRIRIIAKSAK